MSSGNHILLKLLSENQFSGKTYFHTIAYRRGEEELRGRRGGPAARVGRRGDAGVAGQEGDGQEEPGRQFDSIKITSGQFWRPAGLPLKHFTQGFFTRGHPYMTSALRGGDGPKEDVLREVSLI